ncbi:MAG: 2TM domain-containing protein [Candidatus Geothermincolia bacterium]
MSLEDQGAEIGAEDRADITEKATRSAAAKSAVLVHFFIYVAGNIAFFFVNLAIKGDTGSWWCYWITIGWTIGLVLHLIAALTQGAGLRLRQHTIDREMKKELQRRRSSSK